MRVIRPSYLVSSVVRREQSHRRAALLGIATLLVLSTSPVFGHHLIGKADRLLAGHDHILSMCLVALHLMLAPVHGLFHVLLIAGVARDAGARMAGGLRAPDRAPAAARVRRCVRI